MHQTISLKNLSLAFTNKSCFENFTGNIFPGDRIAIIGRNGSGKSSLLNILRGKLQPSNGEIFIPEAVNIGYVEQTINELNNLSGGQRLNKKLSEALAQLPDILLLDEPTNHLDRDNRKSLLQMLKHYYGTLVIVSHDTELLRKCIDKLWHIDNNQVHTFSGYYDNYIQTIKQKRCTIVKELSELKRDKQSMHNDLMQEQKRAAKSKARGQKHITQRKWPTVVSKAKVNRALQTSGKKKQALAKKKQGLSDQLADLKLPEIILPKFSLTTEHVGSGNILAIDNADIGYDANKIILKDFFFSMTARERIAIIGKNASGKTTLLKAILGKKIIYKTGSWHLPRLEDIGYLDQHYSNLNPNLSVIEHINNIRPDWNDIKARRHLNDFLFKKNSEIQQLTGNLSGGEKARASLSLIAATPPKLLILDEISNNLDLETKQHVQQILAEYSGAMLIVCHEEEFLQALNITRQYHIKEMRFI